MRRFLMAILLFLGVSGTSWAQGTTSRVVGLVSDPSGAVIPGAAVTLTNEATGVSFTTTTTSAGTYAFEAVQVGTYTVTVEAQGFKKFSSPGNRVEIGAPTTVNATLQVGAVAETVEVTSAAEVVETSTSGNFGSLVGQRVLEDLPIVGSRGRNPLSLVDTEPGVVDSAEMTGGAVNVHGARDRAWNYTLDGIDINETSAGGSNSSPLKTNPDSLAEFRVLTSNFTADYGRNSGGQVAMITRSGTNEFHGTGFFFYRTPRFNANEWTNNQARTGKVQFVQKIPGFSLGGPIQKNKTFFFVNAQFLRLLRTRTFTNNTVYTADARKGIWRYVKGGRNRPAGVSGASVDASGNVLPGVSVGAYDVVANDPQRLGFDPTVQANTALTPLPNNFTRGDGLNTAGFDYQSPELEKQHDVAFKIDRVINSHQIIFGRFAFGEQDTVCDFVNTGQIRFPGLACQVNTQRSPRNLAINWRWNPTSRITNELVGGFNRFTFNFVTPTADSSKVTFDSDDPSSIVTSDFSPVTPPEDHTFGNQRRLTTYQFVDNFSYVRGAHSFKTGFNFRYQQHLDVRGSIGAFNVNPIVNFSSSINAVDPATFRLPADINQSFDLPALQRSVNFLLGRVGEIAQSFVAQGDAFGPGGTVFNFDARYPELDFYWQDNWKFRKNITLDLGLRWELKFNPRDPEGLTRHPNQLVTAGAPPSNTLRWVPGSLFDNDLNNLGPSVGIAWDPTGSGKSSIRANYRLAYDRINTFVLSSRIYQSIPGITFSVDNTDFGQAGGRLRNLPKLAPPSGLKPTDLVQPPPVSLTGQTVVDPDFHAPKTHMWGLSIQREVFKNTVFSMSYIGRHALNLIGAYDVNQVHFRDNGFLEAFNVVKAGGQSALMNQLLAADTRRRTGETGSDMVHRLFQPELNLNDVATLAYRFATRIQGGKALAELAGLGPFFFVPFPQYLARPGIQVIDSNDFSTYHGLELQLEHRLSRGLNFLVAYTFSKSLDNRSFDPTFSVVRTGTSQNATSTPFDINNRRLNYARSDFDRTHVLQGRWVYELPLGRGKSLFASPGPVLDRVISGWEISGFLIYQPGRPFTVFGGSNTFTQLFQSPADCTGCKRSDGGLFDAPSGVKFFFDAAERAKFSTPAAGALGNTGRNFFVGPNEFTMDLGIIKRTRITERQSLEYRAEFTNVFNHPQFGIPTAVITNSAFGRDRDNVINGSRKIQMALKYSF